jgi:hypothetical protein
MSPVISFAVQMVLGILVPWWIVRHDMQSLSAERLGHAWTEASFWMAIVAFGPLCLPFHFTKTRKNKLIGLGLGFGWLFASLVVMQIVDWLVLAIF